MVSFCDGRQIRRRWVIFRALAVVCFVLGIALLARVVALQITGTDLGASALPLSIMAAILPGTILWVKSRDHALWYREEREREVLALAAVSGAEESAGHGS